MLRFPHLTPINASQCQHENVYLRQIFLSAISYRELIRSNKVIDEIGKASGQTLKKMLELSCLLLLLLINPWILTGIRVQIRKIRVPKQRAVKLSTRNSKWVSANEL